MERGPSLFSPNYLAKSWRELPITPADTQAQESPVSSSEKSEKLPTVGGLLARRAVLFFRRPPKAR